MRRLTDAQEEAVARRREPLLVAAGAGSGKTSVLVERFVRAVREDGIAPGAILAITFTERAAGELLERIGSRLLALGETDAARELERTAYVGTFHGFCARILRLRAHTHARGGATIESSSSLIEHDFRAVASGAIEHDFAILDEALSGRLRRQAFANALGDFVAGAPRVGEQARLEGLTETGEQDSAGAARSRAGERSEAVDLIAAYGAERARATVLGTYAQLRSTGQRAPVLPIPVLGDEPGEHDAEAVRACALWSELLERFGAAYEASKRARKGLDFDDLELLAGELLAENVDVREAWAGRFELLMVDELQDVSPRQLAIVEAIERENLFTVGDELQSIYGFRHADVGLFRARDAELAAHGRSLRLARSFRSRRELLEAVNAVFAKRLGGAYIPLQAGRESVRERVAQAAQDERAAQDEAPIELLLTDKRGWEGQRGRIVGGPASSAPRWRQAEARELARRVAELVRDGQARAGEIAVLLRATGDIELYERALREQGLRTVASAGAFWGRQEVVDLLAHLRALADPADEVGLFGALVAPPVGLSSDGLALLSRAAREQGDDVWTRARAGSAGERVAEHCAWLQRERELADELTLAQLLERAIEHGGHVARLRADADGDGERRLANVRKLVELAEQWERSEGRDLRGFLDEAAFQQGTGGRLASAEAIAEPDAPIEGGEQGEEVRLMSVHAAKGLEFDVVCVADLGRAPSMSMPDLLLGGGGASRATSETASDVASGAAAGVVSEGAGRIDRIGLRLVGLADQEPRPTLDYEALCAQRRQAQAEEEDRVVYVAMTRARERLLLSGSCDFASWPRDRPGAPPIAWLGPALAAELPALCAEAEHEPAPALTVDDTDVPLRCRLNAPGI